jgi:ABC-type transporter Mla MlaB component
MLRLCGRLTGLNPKGSAMLRITQVNDVRGPQLKLEGKLLTPWVDELRSACEQLAQQTAQPRLDLAQLSYVDAAGAKLLADLRTNGFDLAACCPFVAAVMNQEAL